MISCGSLVSCVDDGIILYQLLNHVPDENFVELHPNDGPFMIISTAVNKFNEAYALMLSRDGVVGWTPTEYLVML